MLIIELTGKSLYQFGILLINSLIKIAILIYNKNTLSISTGS